MAKQSPEDYERSVLAMATLVLEPGSLPGRIINADKPNASDDWKPDDERKNGDASIDDYLKDIDAGVSFLTKSQQTAS